MMYYCAISQLPIKPRSKVKLLMLTTDHMDAYRCLVAPAVDDTLRGGYEEPSIPSNKRKFANEVIARTLRPQVLPVMPSGGRSGEVAANVDLTWFMTLAWEQRLFLRAPTVLGYGTPDETLVPLEVPTVERIEKALKGKKKFYVVDCLGYGFIRVRNYDDSKRPTGMAQAAELIIAAGFPKVMVVAGSDAGSLSKQEMWVVTPPNKSDARIWLGAHQPQGTRPVRAIAVRADVWKEVLQTEAKVFFLQGKPRNVSFSSADGQEQVRKGLNWAYDPRGAWLKQCWDTAQKQPRSSTKRAFNKDVAEAYWVSYVMDSLGLAWTLQDHIDDATTDQLPLRKAIHAIATIEDHKKNR